VREFNQGRYWHAHECWEQGWIGRAEPEKTYIQALIQVAAVFHLLAQGRSRPALALCARALEKFARTRPMAAVFPRLEIPHAEDELRRILATQAAAKFWAEKTVEPLKATLLLSPAL
jgi:hypothetical protein